MALILHSIRKTGNYRRPPTLWQFFCRRDGYVANRDARWVRFVRVKNARQEKAASEKALAVGLLECPGFFSNFGSRMMSSHSSTVQHTGNEAADPAEEVTSVVPIVLPVVGALLMFLLAFIAVSMA